MKITRNRIIGVGIILGIVVALYYASEYKLFNLHMLQQYKDFIKTVVENHAALSILVYIIIYALSVSIALPATPLTILGGYLFGFKVALLLVMFSATLGASVVFFTARYLFGRQIQEKYQTRLKKFNEEIKNNGKYYLLSLRLSFFVPFFLVNILAGLTTIDYLTFALTTFFGVVPVSSAYIYAGQQLQYINSYRDILSPHLIVALLILVLISLLPVALKKIYAQKGKND